MAQLENEVFHRDELLIIVPTITQLVKECKPDEVPVFLDPLDAKSKKYIFMAVNDAGKSCGGGHWSLLLYYQPDKMFLHFDSVGKANRGNALKLAANMSVYFNSGRKPRVKDMPSLQQKNFTDCGIHLLCNLENILSHLTIVSNDIYNVPLVAKRIVASKRKRILNTIEDRVSNRPY